MSNLATYPLEDWFITTLAQSWNWAVGTVYVNDTPSFTFPSGVTTYIVVDPGKSTMQAAIIDSYDANANTLNVSSITLNKWAGVAYTQQTHSVGAIVIISDNYQFWEDIATAINSKLGNDGTNSTSAFDLALTGSSWRLRNDGGIMKFRDDANPEVSLSTLASGWGADTKVAVTINDTTPAGLNSKLTAWDWLSKTTINPGGNEQLDLDIDVTDTTIFVQTSAWAGDAGKIPRLNSSGLLSTTFSPTIATTATAWENLTANDLVYMDANGSAYKTVRSATASAQISTTTGVDSSTTEEMIQCEYLSDDKVIVLYKKSADDKIYGRVCTFSRTTITVGWETNISADVLQAACGFTFTVLTSWLFVVAYRKNSDNIGYAVACTVSGTTITAWSPTQLSATIFVASAACTMQACKVSASKFLVIGQKGTTTTGSPQVICGSVSGTTITAGTTVTIAALSGTGTYRCCYIQDDVVFTAYDDGANVRMTPLTISGTTITTKTELNNAATGTLWAGDRLIYLGNGTILLIRNSTQFSINTYNIADQTSWTVATIGTPLYNVNNDTANSSYAQAYYLGNNMLAIANQTVWPSDVRMRLFKIINNSLVPMGDTTIAATAWEMGVCKLNTLQNKIFTVWRETGTTNANFSVYWDTSSQYIGVVSTTTTANNTAPIASSGIAVGTWLTVWQTYYVWDAWAAATSGVKQIGAGITTTSLLLI